MAKAAKPVRSNRRQGRLYWSRNQQALYPTKMDESELIKSVLLEADLPAKELMIISPEVKAELIANTETSVNRGTFGSPSFYVNEELYFSKGRLREIGEEIFRQQ
ncbi:MAG: hypothetical protein VB957_01455 [Pseudomonadales bacterium]|mgnify:CR=1 FL=1